MGALFAYTPTGVGPAPSASSLDTSPSAPSGTPSVSASRPLTSPVAKLVSLTAEASRPSVEIVPGRDAVAIYVEPTTYRVIGYGGFTLPLARRIVAVDAAGVIADWRVQCDVPNLLVHDDQFNPPDSEVMRRLPVKTYTEALRGLSQLLARRYMVFYDRDATLDALRLSLPVKRTTDICKNIPIRNRPLHFGGTCWCRSRNTLVELDMLWGPNLEGLVPDDLVARARGILQLFQRIADPIPHPNTSDAVTWIPVFDWFSRPDVYELAISIMLEEHKSRYEERSGPVQPAPFGRQNFAPQPSTPFYFRITRSYELEHGKLKAANRLMRMAPHLGLALLMMLVDSGLITEAHTKEMRQEHTRRHLASETSMRVYDIAVNAPNRDLQRVFYRTVNAFLASDDDTLLAHSRAAKWQLE